MPSVVSEAIDWAPDDWKADVDNVVEIARVGRHLLHDPRAAHEGLRALKHFCRGRHLRLSSVPGISWLLDQHTIPIREKAVLLPHGMPIGRERKFAACKRRHVVINKTRLRQVENWSASHPPRGTDNRAI